MIQISQETANLLMEAGKESWVVPREDLVEAKGKGKLQTYWLKWSSGTDGDSVGNSKTAESLGRSSPDHTGPIAPLTDVMPEAISFVSKAGQRMTLDPRELPEKIARLVDWNVDLLIILLKEVEAKRLSSRSVADHRDKMARLEYHYMSKNDLVITEAREDIEFPEYSHEPLQHDPRFITIDSEVQRQLRHFLLCIATMYPANPFHNFEHCSHVTLSVSKRKDTSCPSQVSCSFLLVFNFPVANSLGACVLIVFRRIVAPNKDDVGDDDGKSLFDHTYGLTSDPLTQLAVVMAAIFHDVQHPGVPNSQMSKEQMDVAIFYQHESVAEQVRLFGARLPCAVVSSIV